MQDEPEPTLVHGDQRLVKVTFEALSQLYHPYQDAWEGEIQSLYGRLREARVGRLVLDSDPAPGKRGAVDTAVLFLGTMTAFKSAMELLKAWVDGDRSRERVLEVEIAVGQDTVSKTRIAGDATDQTISEIMVAVQKAWGRSAPETPERG